MTKEKLPFKRRLHKFSAKGMLCCLMAALLLAACTPAPTTPSDESSAPSSSAESEPPVEDIPPPYGEAIPPDSDLVTKLSEEFKIGKPAAWLTVPNTTIDNGVMHDPEDVKNTKFLGRTNYDGSWYFPGVLFADFRCIFGDRSTLSQNTVVYGHNVAVSGSNDGSRFSQLLKYEDIEFARENQFITLTTPTDTMLWQVFAVFEAEAYNVEYQDRFYYIEPNPQGFTFQLIVDEARDRSLFDYSVDVTGQDKILTLSTCMYKYKNKLGLAREDQRFVVMAKLLSGSTPPLSADVAVNSDVKMPDFTT